MTVPTNPPGEGVSAREITLAREAAGEAMLGYAEALRFWNAPDDEHTRHQLRALVEDVLDEVLP